MKEIRRGILLAKHDHKMILFEQKHRDADDPIIDDLREVYEATEKIIIGSGEYTALTVEAYGRTMDSLRGEEPLPE